MVLAPFSILGRMMGESFCYKIILSNSCRRTAVGSGERRTYPSVTVLSVPLKLLDIHRASVLLQTGNRIAPNLYICFQMLTAYGFRYKIPPGCPDYLCCMFQFFRCEPLFFEIHSTVLVAEKTDRTDKRRA